MAKGRLGVAAPAAATDTSVYQVPTGLVASLNISIVNRGRLDAEVNVAISTAASPTNAEYIEFGVILPPGGVLERTAKVVTAGERVIVRSSTANCSVRVDGFEESA